MHFRRLGTPLLFLLLIAHGLLPGVSAAQPVDGYLVVLSAFEPELTRLLDQADIQRIEHIDGRRYHLGTLADNDVLLVLSGIGLGRAEGTTRAVLDAFPVASIVFSGIASGINPDLHIGDVTIPTRWTQHDVDPQNIPVINESYPRQDSNLDLRLRRPSLYPLELQGPIDVSHTRHTKRGFQPVGIFRPALRALS